jgi:hypothetical protein
VQSLHLGHTAKSFALKESPSALRDHEDVLSKIFNGEYTDEVLAAKSKERRQGEKQQKKAASKRGEPKEFGKKRKWDSKH